MKFQDWFDRKVEHFIDINELKRLKYHYITTDIYILKKLFNAYKHTGILDLSEIKIGIIDKEDRKFYYFIVNDEYLNLDSLFEYIRNIKGFELLDKLNRFDIENCFSFVMSADGSKDFIPNQKYYFLLSLNPEMYELDYIKKLDKILNEKITKYNTLDGIIDELIQLIKSDETFKYIIATNWEGFGIIGYETKDELNEYINLRNSQSRFIKISNDQLPDELKSMLNIDQSDGALLLN